MDVNHQTKDSKMEICFGVIKILASTCRGLKESWFLCFWIRWDCSSWIGTHQTQLSLHASSWCRRCSLVGFKGATRNYQPHAPNDWGRVSDHRHQMKTGQTHLIQTHLITLISTVLNKLLTDSSVRIHNIQPQCCSSGSHWSPWWLTVLSPLEAHLVIQTKMLK